MDFPELVKGDESTAIKGIDTHVVVADFGIIQENGVLKLENLGDEFPEGKYCIDKDFASKMSNNEEHLLVFWADGLKPVIMNAVVSS